MEATEPLEPQGENDAGGGGELDGEIERERPLVCEQAKLVSIDEEARTATHVISTSRLDRGNRIVEVTGWKLARYRKNPVVLADHDYSIDRIIGSGAPKVEGDALISTTTFDSEGLGAVAFRLIQTGLAKAWSVGWMGLKFHAIGEKEGCAACEAAKGVRWGRHFVEQELLEYSLVAVPANPDAVLGLQRAGLVTKSAAERWIDTFGGPVAGRSDEFYRALNQASRTESRRSFALRAARRLRREP